jgi:hypothetical protein
MNMNARLNELQLAFPGQLVTLQSSAMGTFIQVPRSPLNRKLLSCRGYYYEETTTHLNVFFGVSEDWRGVGPNRYPDPSM